MKNLSIVEFPSNLGLKEPFPGKEPGVKSLPGWLRKHQFHDALMPERILRLDPPEYSPIKDAENGILNGDALVKYAIEQAILMKQLLEVGDFPVVIGGDCSILIGSAIALKQLGDFAVFYLDGHTDFMEVGLSQTGGAGGMAASMVAGKAHPKISDIWNLSPYVQEENIWCVGNREYDYNYENQIRNSEATYISLATLREMGVKHCAESFLNSTSRLDGFWLHIDVDVLHDDIMPCVDSRTPDGLWYPEFNTLISTLLQSEKLKGLEITILDPDLDPSGKYTREFATNFTRTLKDARARHSTRR